MSLNWSIENIKDKDELKVFGDYDPDTDAFKPDPLGEHYQLCGIVECLIWASLTCGFNEITAHNADEVFTRVSMVETIIGAYRKTRDGEAVYYTPRDVKRCIGLKTNATVLSKAAFGKQVALMLRRPSEASLRNYYAQENQNDQVQDALQTEGS